MLVLLIVGALLIFLIGRIDFRKIYLALIIPGPFPLPIVGNGLDLLNKTPAEMLQHTVNLINDYGDMVGVWIKSDYHILMSDPKIIEIFLGSKNFIMKSTLYRYITPWLNDGLLISNGSKWYQKRKLLNPAFHFKILEQFIEIFDRQSCVLIEKLSTHCQSDKVELFPLVTLYALDVICESAMGTEIHAQLSYNSEYVLAVKKMAHIIHIRMSHFMLRDDFFFRFSSLYREHENALKIVHGFTDKVIRERRNKILTEEGNGSGNDDKESVDESIIGQKKKMNFLDVLLQSSIDGKPLSDLDIREEVDTIMFAGHDTTASAILFCLYNIAKYPEVQSKCFQEIRDVLGDDPTKPVTFNDLNNLNYLELVIKETLRLFPSVPFIGRKLQEETKIGKYTLPKGTEVLIPILVMGQNPKLFANPHQFQPERFLAENSTEDTNPFTYIPFSAGSRNCIGQKYAALEIKTVLSKILRFFRISIAEDSLQHPTLAAELTLTLKSKINFYIKSRVH